LCQGKLEDGVGATAGFGTAGGGRIVSESKKRNHGDLSAEIKELTKKFSRASRKMDYQH
jgi:hypothetical protein